MRNEHNLQDWDKLSKAQQQGILDAIEDVKTNGGKSHEDVLNEMRARYKL